MPTALIRLFKEQLENESRSIATEHDLQKRGDYLIWWYFLKLVGLDETAIGGIVCDGAADLGIDAIWIDDDDVVHFYTFKNPANVEATLASGDIDKTLSGLTLILDRKHNTIANEDLRGRIEEIYQTVPTGYRLHVVTSGTGLPDEARIKLDAFVARLQGPSDDFFRWNLEDIERIQDLFYKKNLPAVEEPISFDLPRQPYQVRSAEHDSYLFHVPADSVAALYAKHGELLLQQNIRVYQGDNATNSLIEETATGTSSANFLHFNNGITFLCESAVYDGFTQKLTLTKAQVVNGGQTIRVLESALSDNILKSDVSVVVRVITSQGDKDFASEVSVNLNNQNRIEPSFLRSNEPRVVQLASALASMGWYLERREGEVEALSPAERAQVEAKIGGPLDGRIIRLKEGTQAYVATYMRQPEIAKKNPKRMFLGANDGGYFDRVFNSDLTAEKFVSAHRLSQAVDEYVRKFMTRKRRRERVDDWEKDYAALLGQELVARHGDVIDQVIPQSAVFLTAMLFDSLVFGQGKDVNQVAAMVAENSTELNSIIKDLIDVAKADPGTSRSWPTLLKSQGFFEKVAIYLMAKTQTSAPGKGG